MRWAAVGARTPVRDSRIMRILIVEDDADTRAFVAQGLGQAGHQVAVSADGRDGLFQATGGGFDAIVVDRMLPGLDGLALVRALRAAGDATPVLMLTAVGGIADRVEGLEGGADDYLVKPFAFPSWPHASTRWRAGRHRAATTRTCSGSATSCSTCIAARWSGPDGA